MSADGDFGPELTRLLPAETRNAWLRVSSYLPEGAYLAGGTAVTVHLGHRLSRDLDFFTLHSFDAGAVSSDLYEAGDFEATLIAEGTVNGMLGGTKIQVLDASAQNMIDEPMTVAGVEVAQIRDLLAMKLKVIGDRGELRDYFDIKCIEQTTPYAAEQGMAFYLERYRPVPPEPSTVHIVEGLGHFEDVADDPSLPEARESIERYWRRRQRQVAASLAKSGVPRSFG